MKSLKFYVVIGGLIIFLVSGLYYYLTHDYEIVYIGKNNITVSYNAADYEEDLLPVAYYEYDKNEVYWGYVNLEGKVAIGFDFAQAGLFDENHLAVVKYGKTYALINTKGERLLEKYKEISYLGSSTYYCRDAHGSSLMAYDSVTKIIETKKAVNYDFVGNFRESLAYAVKNGKLGYINAAGDEIIALDYDYISGFNHNFYDGYVFFSKNEKFGILDNTGTVVKSPQYDSVLNDYLITLDYTDLYYEGYQAVPVKKDELWGYINRNGTELLSPQYKEAYPFTDSGWARVRIRNFYNFVNMNGKLLNSDQFISAGDFHEGYAVISKGTDLKGLIDSSGNIVINPHYGYIGNPSQGRVLVIKEGVNNYYLIDKLFDEDTAISVDYYVPDNFTRCKVFFATNDKRYYSILDTEGKRIYPEITARIYKEVSYNSQPYVRVTAYEEKSNLEYLTYIDKDGNLLWKVYK